jgi:uncharacterized protein YcbX
MARIKELYRYPVKGLSPQALAQTRLTPGDTIPGDRAYAIENGPSGFDPAAPVHFRKVHFLMLMRNERLAELRTSFDEDTQTLSIEMDGAEAARGDLRTAEGRAAIEKFLAEFCAADLRGPPKVLSAPGHSFADMRPSSDAPNAAQRVVSIINLASVRALEDVVGARVHPMRFRGNIYVTDWPAWHEFDLLDREIGVGPKARLKVVRRIKRCPATDVDPETGVRDLSIPLTLAQTFGHFDCGIYAKVVTAGEIAPGDPIIED